ncbi:MAG: hypothetical protein P1U56_05890 [Saprospiraceae bacterium]|nr:hypothetical protein [Saprospiraceae bacterium]
MKPDKLGNTILLLIVTLLIFSCTSPPDAKLTEKINALEHEIIATKTKVKLLEKKIEKLESENKNETNKPTSTPTPVETADLKCNLDNTKYIKRRNGLYYLRFLNQEGNTFEVIGYVSAYNITGKVRVINNKITFISGNTTGSLTLLLNCQQMSGSIKVKKAYEPFAVDFIKER